MCHDIVVVGNQFEENQDAVVCKDGFNLCMTGNNLDDHLRHGVVIENTYGSVVSGNMIEECNGIAIILDRDCYGITLSSNVIAHEVDRRHRPPQCARLRRKRNTFTHGEEGRPADRAGEQPDHGDGQQFLEQLHRRREPEAAEGR